MSADVQSKWQALQPRLREAAEREAHVRGSAWSPLPKMIGGVTVRPLTPRMWSMLRDARSPFAIGGAITAGAIAQFIWIVSDDFSFDPKKRDAFIRRVASLDVASTAADINAYLEEAFFDMAKKGGSDCVTQSDSFEAILVHLFAESYGWTAAQTLETPLAQLLQLIRIKTAAAGQPKFNPLQDRIKAEYMAEINGNN